MLDSIDSDSIVFRILSIAQKLWIIDDLQDLTLYLEHQIIDHFLRGISIPVLL